jgi:predicted DNA-binding transcriptional regulator AlpA
MESVETHLDMSSAVSQFWAAPDEALFPQAILVAITNLSNAYFERGRWAGYGPRFIKLGRLVRYKKRDVVAWIEKRPAVSSTSEAGEIYGPQSRKQRAQARSDAKPDAKRAHRTSSGRKPALNEIKGTARGNTMDSIDERAPRERGRC